MKTIGIVGGGFTGTMTAIRLIEKSTAPCEIIIIDKNESLNKGAAYNPYSRRQLLNVIAGKMSAYAEEPDHFLDWVMRQEAFRNKDRTLVYSSFLPRWLYGAYLSEIWQSTINTASSKQISLKILDTHVADLEADENSVRLLFENNTEKVVDFCVLATGNQKPGNPKIRNERFFDSPEYFRNPWMPESVQGIRSDLPVLIVGNGLTMVDTVIGLLEQGYKGVIYSISPNGFNILPHRHTGMKYSKLAEELNEGMSLRDLIRLVNKHIKILKRYGLTAEPAIDSLRPFTQKIWKNLTEDEKAIFISRLKHLWGIARHRIPALLHDKIQQLRIDGKLRIISGRLHDLTKSGESIHVEYFDKKENRVNNIQVSRVINCTGPETNLMKTDKSLLQNCLMKGIIDQDKFRMGIKTDTATFQVINAAGHPNPRLFTLGPNLKGELWESTAVNELRDQAEKLAGLLLSR